MPEYWIASPEARPIEAWNDGLASPPQIHGPGETFAWTPHGVPVPVPLVIDLDSVFGADPL